MPKPTAQRIDLVAPQFKYIAAGGGVVQSIIDSALTQKPYPIKAWIMSRHNPFQTVTCRSDLVKTVEQLDLVVSCDVYLSESAAYADYLLPECTYLERDEEVSDMSGLHPAYALRQQVVEPIGEARPSWQIWKELGEQLGLGQYYPWQDMQTRQLYQLNGDHALAKELRQKGYLEWGVRCYYANQNPFVSLRRVTPALSRRTVTTPMANSFASNRPPAKSNFIPQPWRNCSLATAFRAFVTLR